MKTILLSWFILLGAGSAAWTQTSLIIPFPSVVHSEYLDAEARGLALDGNTLYVAAGEKGLRLLSFNSDGALEPIGGIPLAGFSEHVAVAGGIAFVACGSAGVAVVYVFQPDNLFVFRYLPVWASTVIIDGRSLLVADSRGQVVEYDITVPWNPAFVQSLDLPQGAGVRFRNSGGGVYLAAGSGGVYHLEGASGQRVARAVVSATRARDVAVESTRLAVADDRAGLSVWDLNTPPRLIHRDAGELSACVLWHGGKLASLADRVLFHESAGLSSYQPCGDISLEGAAQDVVQAGRYWIIAAGPEGLFVVDPSNGRGPVAVRHPTNHPFETWYDVALQDGYTYVCEGLRDGLRVFRSDNLTASLGAIGGKGIDPRLLEVRGRYAYVCTPDSGLVIVDISSATNPVEVSRIWGYSGGAYNVRLGGDFAYVSSGDFGLRIFNISNPVNPLPLARLPTGDQCRDVALAGNTAWVAGRLDGLLSVDITNPQLPAIQGAAASFSAFSVAVKYPFAYVADGEKGLRIYDIRNPADPVEVSRVDAIFSTQVIVDGDVAITLNGVEGLRFHDVTNPAMPIFVGDILRGHTLNRMFFDKAGDRLWVAALREGLWEVKLNRFLPSGIKQSAWRDAR